MNTSDNCQLTGQSLKILKEVIIDHWEKLVREVISVSRHESSVILKDHIPELIDQLIDILISGEVNEIEIGKAHGFHRAVLTKFAFEDLMTEYSLLRETIIDYLYPMGNIKCAKLIHKYLDILLKHSSIEFLTEESIRLTHTDKRLRSENHEINQNPVIDTH